MRKRTDGKRRISMFLSLLMIFCLGICSFASSFDAGDGGISEAAAGEEEDSGSESVTVQEETDLTEKSGNGYSVCLDPGHQSPDVDMSDTEPNAPGSTEMKTKSSTGTQGVSTGIGEYQLNLDIAMLVRNELENRGYTVVMTRRDNETAISNVERAQMATAEGCDITVRIHANGSEDSSDRGALAMTSTASNEYVGKLYEESRLLAKDVLECYCEETGFENLGILETDEMTGINWSTVPVMILEMGFMTNPEEDQAMQDPDIRRLMVNGIVEGIEKYFRDSENADGEKAEKSEAESTAQSGAGNESVTESAAQSGEGDESVTESITESGGASASESVSENETETETETESEITEGPLSDIFSTLIVPREENGEIWGVAFEDTESGKIYAHNGHTVMQSASVIKVFIMASVYDRIIDPSSESRRIRYEESYDGELRSLLQSMITVSDNEAANRLVEILGGGDFSTGAAVVNDYCADNGYGETSLGRRFLEENPSGDNYTSALDCSTILLKIYKGTCVSREASEEMLGYLKQQTRTNKIPAGLPEGFTSANKTGEMPEGYGLGCIENDIAIVFSPYGDYVLAVLSNNLGGRNEEADQVITQLSTAISRWYGSS